MPFKARAALIMPHHVVCQLTYTAVHTSFYRSITPRDAVPDW